MILKNKVFRINKKKSWININKMIKYTIVKKNVLNNLAKLIYN